MEADRVDEREVAEVALGDHTVFDQLERLRHRLGHVAHVPVGDVGAEHRAQPRAQRVHVVAERPRHERVVGLAPEVEVGLEPGAQVVGLLDADGGELVDLRRTGRRAAEVLTQLVHARRHHVVAVLGEVVEQRVDVEPVGIELDDRVAVALLPVADEPREQRARPRHATLEEPDPQLREPLRHAPEEQGLAQRLVGGRQTVHVVVDVVGDRPGDAVLLERAVHHRRDAEVDARRPERVVVVVAVEAEHVEAVAAGADRTARVARR